ncbi:MAG: hypothetical protein COA80_07740 [Leeuwenhoekiella sp.]|nr:MAG: hypothetical protein COA80_07740 [Leeuwenhoekiella sp.]
MGNRNTYVYIVNSNFMENSITMKASANSHFSQSLNTLLKRYSLSDHELSKLRTIDESKIVSLAYTETGGFDIRDGAFYAEEREINYKLKIDYLMDDSDAKQTLILLPVIADELD